MHHTICIVYGISILCLINEKYNVKTILKVSVIRQIAVLKEQEPGT